MIDNKNLSPKTESNASLTLVDVPPFLIQHIKKEVIGTTDRAVMPKCIKLEAQNGVPDSQREGYCHILSNALQTRPSNHEDQNKTDVCVDMANPLVDEQRNAYFAFIRQGSTYEPRATIIINDTIDYVNNNILESLKLEPLPKYV